MAMFYQEEADVLVAGGGTAGVVAAIQAARAGASVALVEMGQQLGGTMTTGGVSAPAYFWSRHKQIIAGIGWELVKASVDLDDGVLPDFATPNPRRPSYHVRVSPYVYALLAEEACVKAGVTVHYGEFPVEALSEGNRWRVRTMGKNVERVIVAREMIDCTGDADMAGLLGLERECDATRQPGTLEFSLAGYDAAALDEQAIQARFEAAMASGELRPGDFCYADKPFVAFLKGGGFNQQHVFGADSSTAATQTQANLDGRASLLRLLRFVRGLPGCEKAFIAKMFGLTMARETYRIVGETRITYEDYMSGRRFDDAVCYTLYFIDIHNEKGTHHEFLDDDVIPTIPMGALIPKGSQRILVAGRCLSCDRKAFSALRVEASCMAMGQAAGAAAALGAQRHMPSRDVPIEDVRALLREHGAIVP